MTRDITHNKMERRENPLSMVESNVELVTPVQEPIQGLTSYYNIFKAQVDMITMHRGNTRHHPVVY